MILQYPLRVGLCTLLILAVSIWGAFQVQLNDARLSILQPSAPLYQADRALNTHMGGASTLDIVLESPDSLLTPKVQKQVDALRLFLQSLPLIGHTWCYLDTLHQKPTALQKYTDEQWLTHLAKVLPQQQSMITADRRTANIRMNVTYHDYQSMRPTIENSALFATACAFKWFKSHTNRSSLCTLSLG